MGCIFNNIKLLFYILKWNWTEINKLFSLPLLSLFKDYVYISPKIVRNMRRLTSILLIGLSVIAFLMSCSKSETPINLSDGLKSIVLTSNANNDIAGIDVDVLFNVLGDDGEDYTNQASLYLNGEQLEGDSYSFSDIGSYDVIAELDELTSNTLSLTVIDQLTRELQLSETRLMRNQEVTFTLLDYTGENTAADATFYINDSPISGEKFQNVEPGMYEVYASYIVEGEMINSEVGEFSIYIPKRYLVLEDYTGTWCGYCPGVLEAIDQVMEETEYVSVVAIHKTSYSFADPMHFDELPTLESEFDVQGFPSARLNRKEKWIRPYPHAQAMVYPGQETDRSIRIDSKLRGDNLKIDVDVVFENGSEGSDKIVVYLTENGIIHDQINYYDDDPESPYFEAGNPIPDFEHNNVLRKSLTNVLGDAVPTLDAFERHSFNYDINLDSEYNKDALEVVVMLVNNANTAQNARTAKIETTADFK